jgi:hypothetical protein
MGHGCGKEEAGRVWGRDRRDFVFLFLKCCSI